MMEAINQRANLNIEAADQHQEIVVESLQRICSRPTLHTASVFALLCFYSAESFIGTSRYAQLARKYASSQPNYLSYHVISSTIFLEGGNAVDSDKAHSVMVSMGALLRNPDARPITRTNLLIYSLYFHIHQHTNLPLNAHENLSTTVDYISRLHCITHDCHQTVSSLSCDYVSPPIQSDDLQALLSYLNIIKSEANEVGVYMLLLKERILRSLLLLHGRYIDEAAAIAREAVTLFSAHRLLYHTAHITICWGFLLGCLLTALSLKNEMSVFSESLQSISVGFTELKPLFNIFSLFNRHMPSSIDQCNIMTTNASSTVEPHKLYTKPRGPSSTFRAVTFPETFSLMNSESNDFINSESNDEFGFDSFTSLEPQLNQESTSIYIPVWLQRLSLQQRVNLGRMPRLWTRHLIDELKVLYRSKNIREPMFFNIHSPGS